jgi:hypothetical protein
VALAVVVSTTISSASAAPARPQKEPTAEHSKAVLRYGRKIVLVDAIGVGIGTASLVYAFHEQSEARYWGIVPFLVGSGLYIGLAAAVHKAHDNDAGATTSVVLRCTLPLIGLFAGGKLMDCSGDQMGCRRGWIGAGIGASAGAITATAIDALFLANIEVPAPYVAPTSGGATVGIGGMF